MNANQINDTYFTFSNFPEPGGAALATIPTQELDGNNADQTKFTPWGVKGGFVTVFGCGPNQSWDASWPEPSKANVVLLAPLTPAAGSRGGGQLTQVVALPAGVSRWRLRVTCRAGVKDAQGACSLATLEVTGAGGAQNIACNGVWIEHTVDFSSTASSITLGFKDVPQSLPYPCAAAIALVSLASPVEVLKKTKGDNQIIWPGTTKFEVTQVRVLDDLSLAVEQASVQFVPAANSGLSVGSSTNPVLTGSTGYGQVTVARGTAVAGDYRVEARCDGKTVSFRLLVGPDPGTLHIALSPDADVKLGHDLSKIVTLTLVDNENRRWPFAKITATVTAGFRIKEADPTSPTAWTGALDANASCQLTIVATGSRGTRGTLSVKLHTSATQTVSVTPSYDLAIGN